jgi:hypothetical protein
MRGIPKNIATRDDIFNIAMDLAPEKAQAFIDTLTTADLRRVKMTTEDFYIVKSRVGAARWAQRVKADKSLALDMAIENAKMAAECARREKADAAALLKKTTAAYNAAAADLARLIQSKTDTL